MGNETAFIMKVNMDKLTRENWRTDSNTEVGGQMILETVSPKEEIRRKK